MGAVMIGATLFLVGLVGGIVPVVNTELYLVAMAVTIPAELALVAAVAAASGQMAAKSVMYVAGRGAARMPRLAGVAAKAAVLERRIPVGRAARAGMIFLSAAVSAPPFFAVGFLAGGLKIPFATFFVAGFSGRLVRSYALVIFPQILLRSL